MTLAPASSHGGTVLSVHRLVTAAELRSLHTASITLVAAPPATQLLWPLTIVTTFTPGAIAFDALGLVVLAFGPVPPGEFQITNGIPTGAATNVARTNSPNLADDLFNNVVPATPSFVQGQSLLLVDGGAANSTVGNGALAVDLTYLVLTP